MENIIKREKYLKKIRPFYDSKYIKVITGIRRCGKSEIILQIMNELKENGIKDKNIIYLNLEEAKGTSIRKGDDLYKILDFFIQDDEKYYIFIDEIQHIKRFEEVIAAVRITYNCSLFVTGSNSKLLHGKLQDRLTGRAREFQIYPFTYDEVIEYKKANNIEINEDTFKEYLRFGGMPQRFEEQTDNGIRSYLDGLYNSIIKKDVFDAHPKVDKTEFKNVSKYIISTTCRIFNALSVANYLKNSKSKDEQKLFSTTVNNYANYLEECYFVKECKPYYLKGKECLNGAKKYYAIDVGIRNNITNIIEVDDTFALENIVYNELISRGYEVRYGKLRDGEIDFVVLNGNKKCMIQVTFYMNDQKTFDREYGAFSKVDDHCLKYVFSLDFKDTSHDGITHINIIDFLLHKVDISFN